MKILVVVDMQNDFVTGSLGSNEAKGIVNKVKNAIEHFDGEVVFTMDTHTKGYLDTEEGKKLPIEHCIVGTKGHEIVDELLPLVKSNKVFDKETFASVKLAEYIKEKFDKNQVESVTVCGLCTDICVISNALFIKGMVPNLPIIVKKDLSAGTSVSAHNSALTVMKSCLIDVE